MGKKKYRKFRVSWNKKIYGNVPNKIVTMKSITEDNGFDKSDRIKVNNLFVGQAFKESHPLGEGVRVLRLQ